MAADGLAPCVARSSSPGFFILNSHPLWPSDAIWWHRSGSTFIQVMPWCLSAPSHCLNQCWLVINGVLWHSFKTQFHMKCSKYQFVEWVWKYTCKITSSPRGQWANWHDIIIGIMWKHCTDAGMLYPISNSEVHLVEKFIWCVEI